MRRLALASALFAALAAAPTVAFAQPAAGEPAPPAPTDTPSEPAPPAPAITIDPAQLDALIADAVKKALAEQQEKEKSITEPVAPDAAAASPLRGDDGFVDTRLNFTLVNENMLAKPGETIPSVPGFRFGVPNSLGTLFFDNYDTRFSGFETLSHAVLYRNFRKGHLEAEGAFVLRLNELSEKSIAVTDDGSYILVSWWKDPEHKEPRRVTFTAFPISSDRFRLGYSYRLSWGGNEEYTKARGPLPGFKLQFDDKNVYGFVGAKTAVVLDRDTAEETSKLAFLAGVGADVNDMVRVELNGGVFDRGHNELQDVNDQSVQLFGASAQVAVHKGMPVTSSLDYKLYKNDPERVGLTFAPTQYPGGTSWLVMSEATVLGQTLKDPEKSGSTTVQYGIAGDVNVRAKINRTRVRLDLSYRDLAYVLHSVPSLPTYEDFPKQYEITPDFFAAIGVDHNWKDMYTLGVVVGLEKLATLTSPSGIPGDTTDMPTGKSTAVIRNNGAQTLITILPPGESAIPQIAFKASGQINFGQIFAALADVYYVHDSNQSRLQRDNPDAQFQYEFGKFDQLGINLTLQAKF
ncbi:MAG: hypothetical protein K8W52_30410 [Deltaproteobacteria bacterium]|nr:hypothetical protein [Deltaproteobacteria bacterium]